MDNFIITVARGFGTGGKQIAAKVADSLGIECYENRISMLASEMSHVDMAEYEQVDEKLHGSYFANVLQQKVRNLAPIPVLREFSVEDELFNDEMKIMKELATTESCVIVGKASDYVLKDFDNVLSVYIEAPRPYCVNRIMSRMDCTEAEANHLIERTDKYRADFYKYVSGGNYWTNPVNYDLTLNSGRLGTEKCVEMIHAALKVKFGIDIDKK